MSIRKKGLLLAVIEELDFDDSLQKLSLSLRVKKELDNNRVSVWLWDPYLVCFARVPFVLYFYFYAFFCIST